MPLVYPAPFMSVADVVDAFVRKWHRSVVPFYTESLRRYVDLQLHGSGFIVRWKDIDYLVTARHVLEAMQDMDTRQVLIGERRLHLRNVAFRTDAANDIGVALVKEIMDGNIRDGDDPIRMPEIIMTPIPLTCRLDGSQTLPYYVMMGFPGNKNRLMHRFGKTDIHLYAFSMEKQTSAGAASTAVSCPARFVFDHKNTVSSKQARVSPPDLHGLSGCPIIGLHLDRAPGDQGNVRVCLEAIMVEHDRGGKEIVGVSAEALAALLDRLTY